MRGVQIKYLIDHPEYIPQLAEWLFKQWGSTLGERTPEDRIKPIAWVAHANGQLLGTAALRVHDFKAREDLTPWLGGVFVGPHFRRQGIGAALCATVEDEARSRGIQTLYLFTLDKQAWYSRLGWTLLAPSVWHPVGPVDIMRKPLQTVQTIAGRQPLSGA